MITYTLTITFTSATAVDDDADEPLHPVHAATNRACAALESSPGVEFICADLDDGEPTVITFPGAL